MGDQIKYDKMFREIKKGKVEWGDVFMEINVKNKVCFKEFQKNLNKIV